MAEQPDHLPMQEQPPSHWQQTPTRRRGLWLALIVVVSALIIGISFFMRVTDDSMTPGNEAVTAPVRASFDGRALRTLAATSDCQELQEWFDAAEAEHYAVLARYGSGDESRYTFRVMLYANERSNAVGC